MTESEINRSEAGLAASKRRREKAPQHDDLWPSDPNVDLVLTRLDGNLVAVAPQNEPARRALLDFLGPVDKEHWFAGALLVDEQTSTAMLNAVVALDGQMKVRFTTVIPKLQCFERPYQPEAANHGNTKPMGIER